MRRFSDVLAEKWNPCPGWVPVLPDPDDEPVLQLAVQARVPYIDTRHERDFLPAASFGIQVCHARRILEPHPLETMTMLTAQIPDHLARRVAARADGKHVSGDQIGAIALAPQVTGRDVRNSDDASAKHGRALDRVPQQEPVPGDELE